MLLGGCDNVAMVGLVVGVLVRHLDKAGTLLDRLLAEPEVWHFEFARITQEHGFLRASILRADGEAPSPSTYASHFASLDAAYQQVFRSTVHEVRAEVETRLRREVGAVEAHDDFLVVNRKFTVLVQPSVPVPHGYSQYWYFRPDRRGTVDITLGVPVSGPNEIGRASCRERV